MSALLYDAVQGYVNFACRDRSSPKSRYREAYEWVNRRGGDYIFSFENVCEALGIDANSLRCGLAKIGSTFGDEVKKTRKSF